MSFETKTTWDACGAAFDRYTSAEDSYSENVERPVIESLLGDLSGASALDLGCGSATYSTRLAGRGARVVGVDLSATMLRLAGERARTDQVELDLPSHKVVLQERHTQIKGSINTHPQGNQHSMTTP